jgi:pimeloyl-ACP methyl ester carboxylesterase
VRRIPLLIAALALATSCSSTEATAPAALGATAESTRSETAAPTTTIAVPASPTPVAEPAPEGEGEGEQADLVPTDCVDPPDDSSECFELTLAADPDDATDGTVTLPVTVLRATNPVPLQPVVIPGGGPGFAATPQAHFWADHAIRVDHDIVLYDQRGTGGADPSLECPERDREVLRALQSFEEPPLDRYAIAESWLVCRARLEAEGIDLDDYDTAANAADLDALRSALGYEQWTILGISYGSRLALESMRSFPDGVSSVILDSVYDVDQGRAGDRTPRPAAPERGRCPRSGP